MSWQCPSCGFANNEDGNIRCLCGHEKDRVDKSEVATYSASSAPLIKQVKAKLANISTTKKSLPQKIVILLISIFIFANLGLLDNSITGALVLVCVILFHEAGHLLGMKLFGYRDLQVFFIPLFGAAASGIETNPSSARKAIVALLGPVPGIIVGIIAAVVFFKTKEDFYALCASTFLFINGFNLLPFHPLDGGRFFEYLIFSKKPLYEVGFKLITGLALLGVAFLLKAPILGIVAFMVLLTLKSTSHSAHIAHELRTNDITEDSELLPHRIPTRYLVIIMDKIQSRSGISDPNAIAKTAQEIWRRVCNRPATIGATIGLVAVYIVFMAVGILAPLVVESSKAVMQTKTEIENRADSDGSTVKYEVRSYKGRKVSEIPVDKDGLYNGEAINWNFSTGNKSKQGFWKNGYWHGEWKFWDKDGQLQNVTVYEKGQPISYSVMKAGSLTSVSKDKWPLSLKNLTQDKPEGPVLKKGS